MKENYESYGCDEDSLDGASEGNADNAGENLPVEQSFSFPPICLENTRVNDAGASLEEVQKVDLPVANALVEAAIMGWGMVKSVAGVRTMIQATFSALEQRRKVLGHPYGNQNQTSRGNYTVLVD